MMAHVWNEIEHDLGYKPVTGSLSDQERNFLVMLGHAVRQVGRGADDQLEGAVEK